MRSGNATPSARTPRRRCAATRTNDSRRCRTGSTSAHVRACDPNTQGSKLSTHTITLRSLYLYKYMLLLYINLSLLRHKAVHVIRPHALVFHNRPIISGCKEKPAFTHQYHFPVFEFVGSTTRRAPRGHPGAMQEVKSPHVRVLRGREGRRRLGRMILISGVDGERTLRVRLEHDSILSQRNGVVRV